MQARVTQRRYKEMKKGEMAKKGLYTGAGAGLVLFALMGLLPGSFIGGAVGINIAGSIFGLPLETTVLPRIIVGASMVAGVMLAGVLFVMGSALLGWLIGHTVTIVTENRVRVAEHTIKSK